MVDVARRRIPEATVSRLPVYLRSLLEVAETKTTTISSERLAELAGVTSILNFAPVVISVPPDVSLRKVDLSIELQILSFYQQRRLGEALGSDAAAVELAGL